MDRKVSSTKKDAYSGNCFETKKKPAVLSRKEIGFIPFWLMPGAFVSSIDSLLSCAEQRTKQGGKEATWRRNRTKTLLTATRHAATLPRNNASKGQHLLSGELGVYSTHPTGLYEIFSTFFPEF